MRTLIKTRAFNANSIHRFLGSTFSTLSNQCKVHNHSNKNRNRKPDQNHHVKTDQPETTTAITSLFKELTEILGGDDVIPVKTQFGFSVSNETGVVDDVGTRRVCENGREDRLMVKIEPLSGFEDTHCRDLVESEVSGVVHEITGIVRGENCVGSMEERLEKAVVRVDSEVVDKVLKRCFKVPHLAYRFFNWVKTRDGFVHCTDTYNTILYIAGEAREFGIVDDFLKEMEKNRCEKDMKTWTILFSQYGKAKLVGKAFMYFEQMRKFAGEPDARAYNIMLISLSNAGKGELAMELYKEMVQKEIEPDFHSCKSLINCMAKLGDVGAVSSVVNSMVAFFKVPDRDAHLCVLKSFCTSGRIKNALEWIRDLKCKQVLLDYEYFETLVKGLSKAGRISDALEIVEILRTKSLVDGKIYGIIINGYLRKKQLSKALDMFHAMKESGCLPSVSTYTELMQSLFDSEEYERGCELYKEMLQRGIQIDTVAMMAIVSGHIRQNNITEAWEVFETLTKYGVKPTWRFYSMFIKELHKASRSDEIVNVLHEMNSRKMFISDEIFEWAIRCINRGNMDGIEKAKHIGRIENLRAFEDKKPLGDTVLEQDCSVELKLNESKQGNMDYHSTKPSQIDYSVLEVQAITNILSSSDNWHVILQSLEKLNARFTPGLVTEVLRTCSSQGNIALHFFSWVGRQKGYHHSSGTYNMAIKIAGRGKDFKHMRSLFHEMRRNGHMITPDTWAIMIIQYGRTGLTDIALQIFSEMKATGFNPDYSNYKYLIICLCEKKKGRKVDEAVKLFHEMIHQGHVPDRDLIESYLGCLCKVGNLLEAKKCVDSIHRVGVADSICYSLHVRALCRAGFLEEALSSIENFNFTDTSTLYRYTYASLIHGLLQKGQLQDALSKIEVMKQLGIEPTVHVYTSLIVHYFKEKQPDKAIELYDTMRHEGVQPTIITYSALIRGYMNMGRVSDAWSMFHHLKSNGPSPDFKTYSMFISCLCKIGHSKDALQLLLDMIGEGIIPSTVNFRTVFFGLNREGKRDLAQTVLKQKRDLTRKRKFIT